jgi:hypothetical protein
MKIILSGVPAESIIFIGLIIINSLFKGDNSVSKEMLISSEAL